MQGLSKDMIKDPEALASLAAAYHITAVDFVPTMFQGSVGPNIAPNAGKMIWLIDY